MDDRGERTKKVHRAKAGVHESELRAEGNEVLRDRDLTDLNNSQPNGQGTGCCRIGIGGQSLCPKFWAILYLGSPSISTGGGGG